jgi:hypothetical protein
MARFEEAIRTYRDDVSKLSAAAGSLEFDTFEKLLGQCARWVRYSGMAHFDGLIWPT